ncbi:MAG: hypothetical protein WBL20_08135 [Sphingobium sp.]|uniref:hypothetical protein n=1 Tax=Sphingobium sp. TaxID=1912891 RepID=UPI003BB058E3
MSEDFKKRFDALAAEAVQAADPHVKQFHAALASAQAAIDALQDMGLATTVRYPISAYNGIAATRLEVRIDRVVVGYVPEKGR